MDVLGEMLWEHGMPLRQVNLMEYFLVVRQKKERCVWTSSSFFITFSHMHTGFKGACTHLNEWSRPPFNYDVAVFSLVFCLIGFDTWLLWYFATAHRERSKSLNPLHNLSIKLVLYSLLNCCQYIMGSPVISVFVIVEPSIFQWHILMVQNLSGRPMMTASFKVIQER